MKIYGSVHGVGFRYSAREKARTFGLYGWVRNCSDGCVELVCEGEPEQVQAMRGWASRGPPGARVERIEVVEEPPEQLLTFKIFP